MCLILNWVQWVIENVWFGLKSLERSLSVILVYLWEPCLNRLCNLDSNCVINTCIGCVAGTPFLRFVHTIVICLKKLTSNTCSASQYFEKAGDRLKTRDVYSKLTGNFMCEHYEILTTPARMAATIGTQTNTITFWTCTTVVSTSQMTQNNTGEAVMVAA